MLSHLGEPMAQETTAEILAAIKAAKNPPRPKELPIHVTGGSECGWTVSTSQTTTRYDKEESSSDDEQIQLALTEFWRKLAVEVGAACHGKYWNALCVEATMDDVLERKLSVQRTFVVVIWTYPLVN